MHLKLNGSENAKVCESFSKAVQLTEEALVVSVHSRRKINKASLTFIFCLIACFTAVFQAPIREIQKWYINNILQFILM